MSLQHQPKPVAAKRPPTKLSNRDSEHVDAQALKRILLLHNHAELTT